MKYIITEQITNVLLKNSKRLKLGSDFEKKAHKITLDYMDEMCENSIKEYMEESLISLLGDVIEDIPQ